MSFENFRLSMFFLIYLIASASKTTYYLLDNS